MTITTVPAVIHLLLSSSPAAISGFVVAVIVNAINAEVPRWTPPHVLYEIQEACSPSIANRNTSTSVGGIFRSFRIATSLDHASPAKMFWPTRSNFSCSMYESSVQRPRSTAHAAATSYSANLEFTSASNNRSAAGTKTIPLSSPAVCFLGSFRDYGKFVEFLADQIRALTHRYILTFPLKYGT